MKKRKERKFYFKLMFSMGQITVTEAQYVREAMNKLEQEDPVMRCFQNVHNNVLGSNTGSLFGESAPDFSIYYRGEHVECIDRFLFKIRLKFPDFKVETVHTLQEYYS